MKKDQIRIGGTYLAKVTDKVVPVRIDAANARGGWDATNLTTNRKVHIKSPAKLRGPAPERTAPRGPTPEEAAMLAASIGHEPTNTTASTTQPNTTQRLRGPAGREGRQGRPGVQTPVDTTESQTPNTANPAAHTVPADASPAKVTKVKIATEPKPKKVSGLNAAFEVLKAKGQPMACKAIVDEMLAKGMWKTNGRTPQATIYAAIVREIDTKPGESRFVKTGRGLFTLATPHN